MSITSPKPQTTRFPLQAVFEDERGQIVFIDTPGIFEKVSDPMARSINMKANDTLGSGVDAILYIIDPTRARDTEENKTLGLVRKYDVPKILVMNKSDISKPDYSADYAFYEEEFPHVVKVSAKKRHNFNELLDAIFEVLPVQERLVDMKDHVQPGLNIDSKLFISELIREKVFLFMQEEVPYTVNAEVEEITHRKNGTVYIKGKIITTADRYKSMLIGRDGRMIKEIGMAVRKELETAANKKVFVELTVETNPHWQSAF